MSRHTVSKLVHADLTEQIIDSAIQVHRELGPGLLESTYEVCLCHGLAERGSDVESQVELPVVYKGARLDCSYRIDVMVNKCVIVEVESVDRLESVQEAQLMSYLKLSDLRVGLLVNFNVPLLKDGIRRRVL